LGGRRVRAVQRDDHQVPSLHLPGRAAARAAGRLVHWHRRFWCSASRDSTGTCAA
jgi:hypothetical protein